MRFAATILFLGLMVSAGLADPPRNPGLASDWAMGHGGSAQAAITARAGPTGQGSARLVPYGGGVQGVSPWLVETGRGALYGASLTHLFRYATEPELRFEAGFQLTRVGSISWNIVALEGGDGPDLIVVPQPLGLRPPVHRGSPCHGRDPALLIFEDRPGPLTCARQIRFAERAVAALCGVPGGWRAGYMASNAVPLWDGRLGVPVIFRRGGERRTYLVLADPRAGTLRGCALVGPGRPTNNVPTEPIAGGGSALYIATDQALVRLDQVGDTVRQVWSVPLDFADRTGTTPTLVGHDTERFVVLVEGVCAVTRVLTGRIECSDRAASRLIWLRRDGAGGGAPRPGEVALPGFIRTVENSPAADGLTVIVANYGGYRPDPTARGAIALQWDGARFAELWRAPDIAFNGVPTISTGSGLVYSSGPDPGDRIVARGLRMSDGLVGYAAPVGTGRSVLDAGVNTVILRGGRMVYSVEDGLIELR